MGKIRIGTLESEKAKLRKAMEEGDPKKIAESVARVMAADPMAMETLLYGTKLLPLILKLIKNKKRYGPYNSRAIKPMIEAEIRKIDKKLGKNLPQSYRKILVKSVMETLRKLWRKYEVIQRPKSKK